MSVFSNVRPVWWGLLGGALVALALGFAFREAREGAERLRRVSTRLVEVRQVADRIERERETLRVEVPRSAVSIGELLDVYLPESSFLAGEEQSELLGTAYRLRSVRVKVEGAAWDEVRALLERAGEQTPPWVPRNVELRAGLTGLEGTLHLEALDKAVDSP